MAAGRLEGTGQKTMFYLYLFFNFKAYYSRNVWLQYTSCTCFPYFIRICPGLLLNAHQTAATFPFAFVKE